MTGLFRAQHANVGALATAAIVTLGIVNAPPERYASVAARAEVAAVQMQVTLATEVSAIVNSAPHAAAVGIVPAASAASDAPSTFDPLTALIAILAIPLAIIFSPILLPAALVFLVIASPIFFRTAACSPLCPPSATRTIDAAATERLSAAGQPTKTEQAVEDPGSGSVDAKGADVTGESTAPAPQYSATTSGAVAELAASNATATSGDDPLTSIGRVALNVVGALLSPLWYLAFPITQGLGSLYGYIPPFFDPSGIFSAANTIENFGKWLSFPFRLGEVLFPPSVPEVAATLSAETVQSIRSDAGATTAPAVAGLAITAEATKPVVSADRRGRGAAQRATTTAVPAAIASDSAETTRSATSTITTVSPTAASDTSETQSVPKNIFGAIGATPAGKTAESASAGAISRSAGPMEATTYTPARQRGDKAPTSARAGRTAGK